MGFVTILTAPLRTNLVSRRRVRRNLKIDYPDDDDLLDELIVEASSLIEDHVGYPLGRGVYQESVAGYGTPWLSLSRLPVALVTQTLSNTTLVDAATYSLEGTAGMLYRARGWDSPAVWSWGSTDPEPFYQVEYTGGYLLDDDAVFRQTTLSASSIDNSYNDSAGGFPLLVPGDRLRVLGFAQAGNLGVKTVVSRTASKVIVAETLTTEAASLPVTLQVTTLPAAIARAAIDTTRSLYLQRQWDMSGPRTIQSEGGTAYLNQPMGGLPESARAALLPYVRVTVL